METELERSDGFPPIARRDARVLILGSLPGVRSIQAAEYYAHPRNAFWSIMAAMIGASGDYGQRCDLLRANGIAVWDVLASSVRPGSLDANIDLDTAEVNDFTTFLRGHTEIQRICFNGQKAAQIFRNRVLPTLTDSRLDLRTLPSTSPAHASMTVEQKLAYWRNEFADLVGGKQI